MSCTFHEKYGLWLFLTISIAHSISPEMNLNVTDSHEQSPLKWTSMWLTAMNNLPWNEPQCDWQPWTISPEMNLNVNDTHEQSLLKWTSMWLTAMNNLPWNEPQCDWQPCRGDCSWLSVTLRFISGEIVHGCQSHWGSFQGRLFMAVSHIILQLEVRAYTDLLRFRIMCQSGANMSTTPGLYT
jgi:hypothetical protein